LLALGTPAPAQTQTTERYSFQGFGGWALGNTDNDNEYGYTAGGETEWNNYYFALNLAAQPADKVAVRAQAFWGDDLRGKNLNLDYAFVEWTRSPRLKLRLGKTPVPFGIYTEVYDVGTVRPFYLLPQFYQGPLGLIPKAYTGAGVTGALPVGEKWEIQYDGFGGELRFEPFETDTLRGFDPATGQPIVSTLKSQLVGRPFFGGRMLLASPDRGFDIGGTVFHCAHLKQRVEDGPLERYGVTDAATFVNARAQYQRNALAGRAEWFAALADSADVKNFYAEASYKLGQHWQLAAQYEKASIALEAGDDSVPAPLRRHESFGLALDYWVNPNFVLKLNGYAVDGNMLVRPDSAGLRAALGTIDESTTVFIIGTQFSF
jgi:hypothetical protein